MYTLTRLVMFRKQKKKWSQLSSIIEIIRNIFLGTAAAAATTTTLLNRGRNVAMAERHGADRRFFCLNMCGRSYKNKQHMTRHMTNECGVRPKFRCQYCMKHFTRKQTLKIHILSVHNRSPDEIKTNPRLRLNWTADAWVPSSHFQSVIVQRGGGRTLNFIRF